MRQQDYYELEVSYFPEAAKAGVTPTVARYFGDVGPQFYSPHTLTFRRPPSRGDFLAVVQTMPWMRQIWEDSLLPVVAKNQWPIIEVGCKAASVYLKDADGREVGELRVRLRCLYQNEGYPMPAVWMHKIKPWLARRLRGNNLKRAMALVEEHEYRIAEEMSKIPTFNTEDDVLKAVEKLLVREGMLKPGRIAKQPAVSGVE